MGKLKEFGVLVGFKINKQKTKMLTKYMKIEDETDLMNKRIKYFRIFKVKYLGITVKNITAGYFKITILRHGMKFKKV